MKLTLALGAFATALLNVVSAWACACGVPGLDAALTTGSDTWGARASESVTVSSGSFDAQGRYRADTAATRYRRQEALLLLAYRPWPRLELSALGGYSHTSTGVRGSSFGAADSFVRARFEAWDETPWQRAGLPLPSVAFVGSVRAPTSKVDGLSSSGLGTWEAAVGVALERDLSHRWRLSWLAEGGLRAPDDALGFERRLGPRVTTQLSAWYWPSPAWVASVSSLLSWEGETSLAGSSRAGTGARYLQLGAGLVYAGASSNLRPGLAVRRVLPLSGLGINALVTTSVELSIAYVR